MDRKTHEPHRAAARLVRLSRRDRNTLELPRDRRCAKTLRRVRALHRRLPDTGAARRLYDRCEPLHLRSHAAHGSIPAAMRPLIGDWVWGCDICQLVCPPTQRAAGGASSEWAPRDRRRRSARRSLELLRHAQRRVQAPLSRDRDGLAGRCGAAPQRRRGAWKRARSIGGRAVDRKLAEDPHPMVRGHVAWALGKIGSPRGAGSIAPPARCRKATERSAPRSTAALQAFEVRSG